MVNNSTNINKNHLSPNHIEWWSTIPPISKKITSHLNSLSDVNNSTNINKNHLSPELIEWWSTIPLNELRWEVIFFDIGGIVDHHSMSSGERWFLLILVELLTSFNELKWEVIFVDIGGIVDHHSMSWSEMWFWLILVELLNIIQWVEVRGDFCWYWWNC